MTVKPALVLPPGSAGNSVEVRWSENEAECLETALSETAFVLDHMAGVCRLLWEVVSNASPGKVPRGVEGVLYMSHLALDAMSNREGDVLNEAETRIRLYRRRVVEDREWQQEQEAARERAAAMADMKEFAEAWAAQGNRNPDEKEAAE